MINVRETDGTFAVGWYDVNDNERVRPERFTTEAEAHAWMTTHGWASRGVVLERVYGTWCKR